MHFLLKRGFFFSGFPLYNQIFVLNVYDFIIIAFVIWYYLCGGYILLEIFI